MNRRKASWIAHADRNRGGVKKRPDYKIQVGPDTKSPTPESIGTDLPPLEFPPFAAKYLGEKTITKLRELTKRLDEYELLLLRKTLSMDEVVQYLSLSGDLDMIRRDIEEAFEDMQQHSIGLAAEAVRLYGNEEKALKKVKEASSKSFETLSVTHHRVLFGALWSDTQTTNMVEMMKELLATTAESVPQKILYANLSKDPFFLERLLMSDIRKLGISEAHAYSMPMMFFLIRLLKQKPHSFDSDPAEDKEMGDIVAEELRGKNIEPGQITLPNPEHIPEITKVTFTKSPGKNPLLFGSVHMYFNDPKGKKPLAAYFNISRLNGDICLPNGMLASPEELFAENGKKELFLSLRAHVMRAVYEAIRTGALKEIIDTVQQDIQRGIEEATEAETNEMGASEEPEAQEEASSEDGLELGDAAEATVEAVAAEPTAIQPAKREKHEKVVIKTLAWEKTKSALERLGVTVKKQGPHYKLYHQVGDEVLTCSFPNEHTKPGTLAWIVKTNLKILKISPKEFLDSLK